jgi:hypothetical protein
MADVEADMLARRFRIVEGRPPDPDVSPGRGPEDESLTGLCRIASWRAH